MRTISKTALTAFSMASTMVVSGAMAAPVDLNTWTAESYSAVAGFGAGVWTPAIDGSSVHQSVNGQPTLFVGDFNVFNTDVRGRIRVNSNNDDDYIGFAIGYQPGDTANSSADYLLVDWKQFTQNFDFGTPSNTPGSTADVGLAVSRVSGIPTADEFWGHVDFNSDPNGGLQELARGTTRGATGWDEFTEYNFRFIFMPTSLQVFVNNQLELSINGSFSDGRLGFYNFSQRDVTYSAFTVDSVPPQPPSNDVPEPLTLSLFGAGLAGIGLARRRRR